MSLRAKFRQLLNWINEARAKDEFPLPDFVDTTQGDTNTWTQGETKQSGELQTLGNFATVIDFLAGWWDSKLGQGPAPANGVVTDNPEVDGWLITGVLAAVVLFVVRKLFA